MMLVYITTFFLKICKIALFNGVIYLSFSGPVIDRNDRK